MSAKLLPRLVSIVLLALLLSAIACQQSTPSTNQSAMNTSDSKAWDSYLNEFLEAYFVARPDFAVHAGRHEFDGKLPDWSAEGLAREAKRLHVAKDRVASFPESALDERQRFERDYVAAQIDSDLFWLESAEWPLRCLQFYADAIDPDVYVSREYAPLEQRLKASTAYAKAIPIAFDQIRKNLRAPLPTTFVAIVPTTYGGCRSTRRRAGDLAPVKDEQLRRISKRTTAPLKRCGIWMPG